MRRYANLTVMFLVTLVIICSVAFPHNGSDLKELSRSRRDIKCGDKAHKDNNICCSLCPAGKRVTSSCTEDWEMGSCEECDSGTYMDHPNYLKKCLPCTQCRALDQEVVKQCTHTQNAVCQCKAGMFCLDDQPCEVCRTCLKCDQGEMVVRNCTATSNTECKRISPSPDLDTAKGSLVIIIPVCLVLIAATVGILLFCYKKKKTQDSPSRQQKAVKEDDGSSQRLVKVKNEDERRGLCESLDSSASNSQHSLIVPAYCAPHIITNGSGQADYMRPEEFPQLTPVNGFESLQKCFGYFEDMDLNYHSRFFRHLGINENVIKSKESAHYEDRIHALLHVWLENQGKKASLNDLLSVLLVMNQRRTAEFIKEEVVKNGHYVIRES